MSVLNAFTLSVGEAVTRRIAVNAPDRGASRVSVDTGGAQSSRRSRWEEQECFQNQRD